MMNNWIEWKGGNCPVNGETIVEVVLSNGESLRSKAKGVRWSHKNYMVDIAKYRIVSEQPPLIDQIANTKAEIEKLTEQSEQVNKALSEAKTNLETLIDQLEKEIVDKTGLSCVIGVQVHKSVKALSGQAKQDKLTSIAELPEGVAIYDPSTWQGDDIVKCVKAEYRHPLTVGNEYVYVYYDEYHEFVEIEEDDNNQLNGFHREASEFRFVRRP